MPTSPGTLPKLDQLARLVQTRHAAACRIAIGGRVCEVAADRCLIEGVSQHARVGDIVRLEPDGRKILAQTVRVCRDRVTVKPFAALRDVRIGTPAWLVGPLRLEPHETWTGRVFNALGEPIDNRPPPRPGPVARPLDAPPPPALTRQRVTDPVPTGITVIDLFTPLCRGQRVGVFSASGIGKSTLLQMLAAAPGFDVVVIALVGERGREVREFLEDGLSDNMPRTVGVVATSDESAMMRRLAPMTATTIAEHFRARGEHVLLIVDSVTRFAHAARDAAMAAGEPPISRGYTPSVFSDLSHLLERTGSGPAGTGTITGVFSVLVDGDDHNEPVADSIRGILDGHIVLDRKIAEQGRYPAVDPLRSISRMAARVWTTEQSKLALSLRAMMSRFEETRDLRALGGYTPGADKLVDQAVDLVPALYDALTQSASDPRCDDPFQLVAQALASGRSDHAISPDET